MKSLGVGHNPIGHMFFIRRKKVIGTYKEENWKRHGKTTCQSNAPSHLDPEVLSPRTSEYDHFFEIRPLKKC